MPDWQQPRLERETGSKGRQYHELLGLRHPSYARDPLMEYDVTEGAALFSRIELPTAAQLLFNPEGDEGESQYVRMGVAEDTGCIRVVLHHDQRSEPFIQAEIQTPQPVSA